MDEKVKYLLSSPRADLPLGVGRGAKEDYEYQREGTLNLFVMVEPKAGFRHIMITEQRTAREYALAIRWLVDIGYPEALKIILIDDNLNTHCGASLYKTFEPAEARRLLDKIEYHHTPKHGSWLNMAEIEISVFERVCLNRRIADQKTLEGEVRALETERNRAKAKISWQFTCEQARVKLHRLYPILSAEVS
ncbi:MAG: transposase [Microcystaceae cyanobacterium]